MVHSTFPSIGAVVSITHCFVDYIQFVYTFCICLRQFSAVFSMQSIKMQSENKNVFKSPDEIPMDLRDRFFDVLVVLGGGLPLSPNDPPLYVQERCKFAKQVYEASSKKPKILTLSAGTAHLPQFLSSDGLPVWESTASASYLMEHLDIPPQHIYVETSSYDTISNAFFTRTNFCDISGWRRLLIITNEFHMRRTKLIFDWIMNVQGGSTSTSNHYELYYLSVPDKGLSDVAIAARKKKELKSAENVKNVLIEKYTSLEDVFDFLTQKHSFYNAKSLVDRANRVGNSSDSKNVMSNLKLSYGGTETRNIYSMSSMKKSEASSFSLGTMVGIILTFTFQFFSKHIKGAKSHRN